MKALRYLFAIIAWVAVIYLAYTRVERHAKVKAVTVERNELLSQATQQALQQVAQTATTTLTLDAKGLASLYASLVWCKNVNVRINTQGKAYVQMEPYQPRAFINQTHALLENGVLVPASLYADKILRPLKPCYLAQVADYQSIPGVLHAYIEHIPEAMARAYTFTCESERNIKACNKSMPWFTVLMGSHEPAYDALGRAERIRYAYLTTSLFKRTQGTCTVDMRFNKQAIVSWQRGIRA